MDRRALLSHELNTALAMLLGCAELLATREDAETRSEATDGIALAVARLRGLVETITGAPLDDPLPARWPERSRVLVIDDDPSERDVLRAAFPEDAFDLVDTTDAGEAFELLEQAEPDFVILNWKLAGGAGAETLAELKLRNPELPVVVLDERGDARDRQIAMLLDAERYVPRPFNPLELVDRIEELANGGCRRQRGAVTSPRSRRKGAA